MKTHSQTQNYSILLRVRKENEFSKAIDEMLNRTEKNGLGDADFESLKELVEANKYVFQIELFAGGYANLERLCIK